MASPIEDSLTQSLVAASDQYLVSRGDEKTVIAGYHWFGEWGRDTMIALPGLTLPTGKYQVARNVLRTFSKHVNRGMLPNRFPDAGETPEYNTVDAALWFVEAARAYLAYTGNALCIMEDLASRFGYEAARKRYRHMGRHRSLESQPALLERKPWLLYDVVDGGPPDPSPGTGPEGWWRKLKKTC